jgi:hypothetical protein
MTEMNGRRDPVPLSAKVYLKKAMTGVDAGVKLTEMERLHLLKEAYNHLENAAFAEAEERDKLLASLAKEKERVCEIIRDKPRSGWQVEYLIGRLYQE